MDYYNNGYGGSPDNYDSKKIIADGKRSISVIATVFIVLTVILSLITILIAVYVTKDELYDEIYASISAQVTEDTLTEYARGYYIPAGYTDNNVAIANEGKKSVMVITSTYPENGSTVASNGSGFVVTANGYVVTNAHVVTHTSNGILGGVAFNSDIKGTLAGSDTQIALSGLYFDDTRDLAILRINSIAGLTITPVTFGDSSALTAGQSVLAIGNAGGLGISVTTGVVSRTAEALSDTAYGDTLVIQTDAAVNPGNSGGPLYDYHTTAEGVANPYCIGVVSFKLVSSSESSKYENIGFAVAASEITAFLTSKGITNYQTCFA